jgi:hypothetical protein
VLIVQLVQLQNWRTNVAGIEATGKVQKGRNFKSEKAQCEDRRGGDYQ